ncbi:MAG TPA: hypothetical protein VGC11_07625 [Acidimicrobiia bacterium]
MEGAVGFLIFMGVAGVLYFRLLARRNQAARELGAESLPRPPSRRQHKLDKLREFDDPIRERPTIHELMMEEVRDTGVDQIPGGEGIETPVLLRVWHRDEPVRRGCADDGLRFVVKEGVDPGHADIDDVLLMCDDPLPERAQEPWDELPHLDAAPPQGDD